MAIHNVRTEIGISSTPEELEVSAGEMGIPVEHLKKMLIYLEKMRVEAERLNLAPSIACNAAVTFISNAIKHNYEEAGWFDIHYDCAQALMHYVDTAITNTSKLDPKTKPDVH